MSTQIISLSIAMLLALTGLNKPVNPQTKEPVNIIENQPVRNIVISANDQMKFDLNEIKVKAGETVKLTLKHTGNLNKNVMGHNFVLLTKGTDIAKFAQKAMNEKDNEYIPSSGVLAHTKLIGGGESTTIQFTAPQKGTYDFICSFPGHYAMMKGKFIVE